MTKEASYSPLNCHKTLALFHCGYPVSLKEQILTKFPVTFHSECRAMSVAHIR